MKRFLQNIEQQIPTPLHHQDVLRNTLQKKNMQRNGAWFPALAFAAILLVVMVGPINPNGEQAPSVSAAELLQRTEVSLREMAEKDPIFIRRAYTYLQEGERIQGYDEVVYSGNAHTWSQFAGLPQQGSLLWSSFAERVSGSARYTKYTYTPEDSFIVAYPYSDITLREQELMQWAEQRGIAGSDKDAMRALQQEYLCTVEADVIAKEQNGLHEILFSVSNIAVIQQYIDGGVWVNDPRTPFLEPSITRHDGVYHIITPYKEDFLAELQVDARDVVWEVWMNEQGVPLREELKKNGEVVQLVEYSVATATSEQVKILTLEGWRAEVDAQQASIVERATPWSEYEAKNDPEIAERRNACARGDFPLTVSGGEALPGAILP